MLSRRTLLIEALKKLYRKTVDVKNTQGVTLTKNKKGAFVLIYVGDSMITLLNIASRKREHHLTDIINVNQPPYHLAMPRHR